MFRSRTILFRMVRKQGYISHMNGPRRMWEFNYLSTIAGDEREEVESVGYQHGRNEVAVPT